MQDRIYRADDGHWYFKVRGNGELGPFVERHEAERALARCMRQWRTALGPRASWSRSLAPLLRRSVPRQT